MSKSHSTLSHAVLRFAFAGATAILMASAVTAAPPRLEVAETLWGFDGRVVPERFNILTVRVVNPTGEPFDGSVLLIKSRGGDERAGAPYSEPCYLTAYGSRWVQFHPFISGEHDSWRLEWGRRLADRLDLPRPTMAAPARVLLVDDDGTRLSRSGFRTFPAALFPPTAAATLTLDSVILDHVPRWETTRREAFLDWLRGGGTVHVLRDGQDRPLGWPSELSALNTAGRDGEPVRVGSGTVIRHPQTRRTLTPETLASTHPERKLERSKQAFFYDPSGSILRSLTRAVRVRYRWWLINLMAVGYIAAIGPGVHLVSRRWRDYRLTWLAMALLIAASAALFHLAGRRGRGETSAVLSLSVARDLGSGRFLVTQWIDAFAARGSQYRLTHDAPRNLYATTSENEAVNGVVESGRGGAFSVDIPVCSHRPFMHQAVLSTSAAELTSREAIVTDGVLKALSVTLASDFARVMVDAVAVFGDRVFPVSRQGDRLVLSDTPKPGRYGLELEPGGTPAEEVFSRANVQQSLLGYGVFDSFESGNSATPDSLLKRLLPGLLLWSMDGVQGMPYYVTSGRDDPRLRLFALASSPPEFHPTGIDWGRRVGMTLYQFDVPMSAGSDADSSTPIIEPPTP